MKITMPKGVTAILEKLKQNGFEAYIVGGCVRDMILGRLPQDWDITTNALPDQVKSLFDRTYDTGIKHGTVTVRLFDTNWEVTTYRSDGLYEDFRHPNEVFFTDSLSEDLKRRDFTINAIAYNPKTGFVDEHMGIEDIKKRIIRCVNDPDERFGEDALRMLRALRFSGQLGFEIEEKTCAAIAKNAPLIAHVSAERIKEELDKLIVSDNVKVFGKLWDTGLMEYISGDIFAAGKDCAADLGKLPRDKILRWAQILKFTKDPRSELKRLRYDNKSANLIIFLCANEKTPIPADKYGIRKALSKWGEDKFRLLTEFRFSEDFSEVNSLLDEILRDGDCISLKQLAVNGRDLESIGIPKGEALGKALACLLDEVHKNPELNNKEKLLPIAEDFIKK